MSLPVLTAVTGPGEAALVAGLERSTGEVRVVRRCVDLADLLSATAAGLGRAAVISADLHGLDRESAAQLERAGVALVGVADPTDGGAPRRLASLGVRRVLPVDAAAAQIAAAVVDAVQELAGSGAPVLPPSEDGPRAFEDGPGSGVVRSAREATGPAQSGTADPADALAPLPAPALFGPADARAPVRHPGRVIAVWGPTGAPGRTTVAVSLAGELAARGAQTLLVDADTYGPSVAQTLGLLDESGGIAGAVRWANAGVLDVDRLARLAPSVSPTLRVLTGLPQPSRWPELRPSSLDLVWRCSRALARWTVVDCGFGLEADEELSYDTAAPRRNGSTLSALAAADLVVVVGVADPVGLQRLVRGLEELRDAVGPSVRHRVVVTRVRASSIGSSPERRVSEALSRYAGIGDPWLVPEDRAACDEAMLTGRMLVEAAPGSPARRAFARIAADLDEAVVSEQLDALW